MDVLFYEGVHSVIFGSKHSWLDWHLVPLSKPVIPPPELVENYVDIPGANGQLDLSEVVNGFPTYKNRSGEFSFVIDPAYWFLDKAYDEIANELHGKRTRVILTDDPNWFYEGRVSISSAEAGRDYSTISFKYNFDPFKLSVDVVPGLSGINVSGTTEVTVPIGMSPMRTVPRIMADVTSGSMTATLKRSGEPDSVTDIATGSFRYPALVLGPGSNKLVFSGEGTVTIEVRGGSL